MAKFKVGDQVVSIRYGTILTIYQVNYPFIRQVWHYYARCEDNSMGVDETDIRKLTKLELALK